MKYTVKATDYPDHEAVTTEGTLKDAVKAFQRERGLDGLNLAWTVTDEKGNVTQIPLGDPNCVVIPKPPLPEKMTAEVAPTVQKVPDKK